MSIYLIAFICACIMGAITLCVFLRERTKNGAGAKAVILKAQVSILFLIAWGILATQSMAGATAYTLFIGAGLAFGLLGDIWLDLKFCCRDGEEDTFTTMGFASFAVGHVMYVAAIAFGVSAFKPLAILPAAGIAVVAALVVYFGEKAMKLNYGSYKMISTLYGALMFFMTALALFSAIFAGAKDNMHLIVMFIGGVFFIASDLILSGTYFGEGKNRPVDIITNHAAYYVAQYIIAATLLLAAK